MRFIGSTVFITKPGEYKELRCAVCGSICNVKRNVMGPRCYAEAVGKREGLHDKYECPHVEEDWHEECFDLSSQCRGMSGPTLRWIAAKDLFDSLDGHVDAQSKEWLKSKLFGKRQTKEPIEDQTE